MRFRLFALFAFLLLATTAMARPAVPPELENWRAWVLHGNEAVACPFLGGDAGARQCAWPGRLQLEADSRGARFSFEVSSWAEVWVALPGNAEYWPQEVTVDGRALPVVLRGGWPQLRLTAPGTFRISGQLHWERQPESLPLGLPRALVSLLVDGEAREPVVDGAGRLWFGRRQAVAETTVRKEVAVRVFRHLADGIPPLLETRVELDVSGPDREILLGRALPAGFAPVSLDGGGLPARLEADGNLRVQVRPGRWVLNLGSRQTLPATPYRIEARALIEDVVWPATEIWVFAADHRLRTARIEGVPGVDPRQSGLPEEWQSLPAFALDGGAEMKLVEQVRGDANPQPEPLALTRELWLDFDGAALTARDRLSGTLERSGRLAFAAGVEPGRVTLNDEPQVITRLGEQDAQPGIEIRPGPMRAEAISRFPLAGAIPASGLVRDVQSLSAVLNLPPGWTLIAAGGVDRAASWVSGWTLWDIFLVLVLTVAAQRLAGNRVGALAFATLVLTHDVAGAPVLLWLNLVATLAVWRVLPAGRLRQAVNGWRLLAIALLGIVLLGFAVDQVRRGIYPELEYAWRDIHQPPPPMAEAVSAPAAEDEAMVEAAPAMDAKADGEAMLAQQALEETAAVRHQAKRAIQANVATLGSALRDKRLPVIDPAARVQTGPGVPDWQWNRVELRWDGPVAASQRMDLWLVGPLGNRLLCFLRVLLCVALLWALSRGQGPATPPVAPAAESNDDGPFHEDPDDSPERAGRVAGAVAGLALALGLLSMLLAPGMSEAAAFPDESLLAELGNRLRAAPDCLPQCAALAKVRVEANAGSVVLRMRVDSSALSGVPLPSAGNAWHPRSVLVDGRQGFVVEYAGVAHVALEAGSHEVVLEGPASGADVLPLSFPLSPGWVETSLRGWQAGGVVEGRLPGGSLELRRTATAPAAAGSTELRLLNDPEPPFVIVERRLVFDIDWRVSTQVTRVAPASAPLSLRIPLLPGENVTSRVNVSEGQVVVALAQDQAAFGWESVLKPVPTLTLAAAKDVGWVERWFVAASPRWHVEAMGLPPQKGAGGTEWQPWPGESLRLSVLRPRAIAGETLTVEALKLHHEPGHRLAATRLEFRILASEGGEFRFPLPPGAVLEAIEVDGVPQVIAGDGREAIIACRPGEQQAVVRWRSDQDMGLMARTPSLDFGTAVSNLDVELAVPPERWALFTGGPGVGPAILFWGVLLVVIGVALALGRVPSSPLRPHEWALLGLGMSTTMLPYALLVVAWFFVMAGRGRVDPATMRPGVFNFTQVLLALFTLLALGALLSTIPQSLVLGTPDMQIAGNGSHAGLLHWFLDRVEGGVPQGWLVSVPMWTYRLAMLAWSLWLAFALTRWLKWGWQNYAAGALWRTEEDPPEAGTSRASHPSGRDDITRESDDECA